MFKKKKKLVKLHDHNIERRKSYQELRKYPKLNGLECPKCKKELMDSDSSILTSSPPQKNVHCSNPNCDYKGYRVA